MLLDFLVLLLLLPIPCPLFLVFLIQLSCITHLLYTSCISEKRSILCEGILQCFNTWYQSLVCHQVHPSLCLGLWLAPAVASSLCFDSPVQCCLNSMPQGNTVKKLKAERISNIASGMFYLQLFARMQRGFRQLSLGVCPWGWRGYGIDCHFYHVSTVRWFCLSSSSAYLKLKHTPVPPRNTRPSCPTRCDYEEGQVS